MLSDLLMGPPSIGAKPVASRYRLRESSWDGKALCVQWGRPAGARSKLRKGGGDSHPCFSSVRDPGCLRLGQPIAEFCATLVVDITNFNTAAASTRARAATSSETGIFISDSGSVFSTPIPCSIDSRATERQTPIRRRADQHQSSGSISGLPAALGSRTTPRRAPVFHRARCRSLRC